MSKFEKIKLIILTILGCFFLSLYYLSLDLGRFKFHDNNVLVIDTKTGTIYIPNGKTYLKIDEYKKRK
jgi:hypothetical protein